MSDCEEAFIGLKEALVNVVTLNTPRFDGQPFYIGTYASRYLIGATIEQVADEGHHHPLAFWSCKLKTRKQIGVQGSRKPSQSSVPYSAMRPGSWVIASKY